MTNSQPDRDNKETSLIESYRLGQITLSDLSQRIGLDRIKTDARLKELGIFEGSVTAEDLEADRLTLERLLGPAR